MSFKRNIDVLIFTVFIGFSSCKTPTQVSSEYAYATFQPNALVWNWTVLRL